MRKGIIIKRTILILTFWICLGTLSLLNASSFRADIPVSELKANARHGQVFLTWNESETPAGTTFNVYVSDKPIKDVAKVRIAGHHIESHSARDWWEDPSSFYKDKPSGKPVGFMIEAGGQRLDPQCGLFVYTLKKDDKSKLYFAVTPTDKQGEEDRTVVAGENSLTHGVKVIQGALQPIWIGGGQPHVQGSAKGKALWLNLHAKGLVVPDMEYLMFGDESMGWRAGLPVKFSVRVQKDELMVRPTDRVWINRPHLEASDGGTSAIWSMWYGYNSFIYDRSLMSKGQPINYTEKILLKILDWVNGYYQPDPKRWYCSGSSMGGCGTISFGLRHPELFSSLHAHVPIVSYTYLGTGSARRFESNCWVGPINDNLKTNEGIPLLQRMNSVDFVSGTKTDLPFLFLINGRQDASIPWQNNPPFYRALSAAHQGFAAYWDNGTHPTSGTDAPEDVKKWSGLLRNFRLDESFPAFRNTSSDRNPGNGNPEDGDLIGWINRGMEWRDIEDKIDHYSITILSDYQGLQYPVQTDIMLRRVQNFKPRPMEQIRVFVGEIQFGTFEVRDDGRIVIPRIVIPSRDGVRIRIVLANK